MTKALRKFDNRARMNMILIKLKNKQFKKCNPGKKKMQWSIFSKDKHLYQTGKAMAVAQEYFWGVCKES